MKTTTKNSLVMAAMCLAASAGLAAVGCAHSPSDELIGARRAYGEAKSGVANEVVPDMVYEAKMALDDAEYAFQEDPGDQEEIHLAYIARRKAEIAMVTADRELAEQERDDAAKKYVATLAEQRNEARMALEGQSQRAQRRALAEARMGEAEAWAALEELARIVKVYRDRETNEVVITLSGQVLFEHGKAELMPVAKRRLAKVAEVLKKQGDGEKIVIEGHTDTTGSTEFNDWLSRQRAQAVKDFFAEQGVDSSRVETVGRGEHDPIATNNTPEGRANNRRVEIIIKEPMRTARR